MTKRKPPKFDFNIYKEDQILSALDDMEKQGLITRIHDDIKFTEKGKQALENARPKRFFS